MADTMIQPSTGRSGRLRHVVATPSTPINNFSRLTRLHGPAVRSSAADDGAPKSSDWGWQEPDRNPTLMSALTLVRRHTNGFVWPAARP